MIRVKSKRLAIAPWKKIASFCVTEETEDKIVNPIAFVNEIR